MPDLTKDAARTTHRLTLDALVRAACEELGTDKVIIVAEVEGNAIVSVSAGTKGMGCGILAEALLIVGDKE